MKFDANRYSTPPEVARKTAVLRASASQVRVFYQGQEVACHARCYDRGQLIRQDAHHLAASRCGRRIFYRRSDLLRLLENNRIGR